MLEIKNICKTYRPKKGVPVQALKNVSLQFSEKGMVFILGKSGCGKSTLLNCIGGLDTFDSGELIIKGKSSKDFRGSDFDSYRNTFIGFIFQEYNILSEFNVEKNIALALELQGKKATPQIVKELLEKVDLTDQGKRKTNELSGGQKQRIAIARALIKDPEIIIADEPTGALDSATGKQVFDTLKKLSEDKLVIIVSHDREFAEIYGDRIIEMKDGVVISDETKHHISGQKLNSGISVIGTDVIHIEAGHKVTEKEVEFITKYLQKREDGEAFISLNNKTNKKFREIAKIDENNASEKFEETTPEDLGIKQYNRKDLHLIKSRLKFKDSFKMGASSLKVKPVRLVFTILLSLVAFTMFAIVDTLSTFNGVSNSVKSFQDSNVTYLTFTKESAEVVEEHDYINTNNAMFTDADVEALQTKTGVLLKKVYKFGRDKYSSADFTNGAYQYGNDYYTNSIAGVVELTKAELEQMNCTLLSGRYPTSLGEIVITKYQLETFQQFSYKLPNGTVDLDKLAVNETTILNKVIRFSDSNEFTIVGVIDTKFDSERYKPIKELMPNESAYEKGLSSKVNELYTIKQSSLHNVMIVSAGEIDNMLKTGSQKALAGFSVSGGLSDNVNHIGFSKVANINQVKDYNTSNGGKVAYYYKGNNVDNFVGNAVLVSKDYILSPLYSALQTQEYNGDELVFAARHQLATKFDVDSSQIENWMNVMGGLSVYNGFGSYSSEDVTFVMYMLSYEMDEIFKNDGTINLAYSKILDCILDFYNGVEYNLYVNLNSTSKEFKATVKGIFNDSASHDSEPQNINDTLILCDELYVNVNKINESAGNYTAVMGVMPLEDNEKLTKILEFHFSNTTENLPEEAGMYALYSIENPIMQTMDMIVSLTKDLMQVLTYVGLGFCLFASLMLMNFITISIADKKREIGILRALGSRKSDVFGIFFNESLIIAFINFVLSAVASFITATAINNALRTEYGILITVLNYGARQIGLLVGVSVLVAFVASLLPVMKIARKQPIDAINNR